MLSPAQKRTYLTLEQNSFEPNLQVDVAFKTKRVKVLI